MKKLPSISRINECLLYEESTGNFFWKARPVCHFKSGSGAFTDEQNCATWNAMRAGRPAGRIESNGYIRIRIDNSVYSAHRLAWFISTGVEPKNIIDHINRNPSDNRFVNLREATNSENMQNMRISRRNKSGMVGLYWDEQRRKWHAQIKVGGKKIHLGRFDNFDDAKLARLAAERKLHPFSTNCNTSQQGKPNNAQVLEQS